MGASPITARLKDEKEKERPMADLIQPSAARYLKALIFSPPGHGKTWLAGTAQDDPRTSPCLFIDFEGGTDTLVGRDIDVVRIRDWKDYQEAFQIAQSGRYRSCVVDSLGETQLFALTTILGNNKVKRYDDDLLTQQDYGIALVQMRRFVRQWRDLDLHIIMTALARDAIDAREGSIVVPKFAGQFTEDAGAMMSVVAYLALTTDDKTKQTRRVLLLKNQPKYRVKARTPMDVDVPDTLDDPTIGRLLDVLHFPAAEGRTEPATVTAGPAAGRR
jgi:hypothetical protein